MTYQELKKALLAKGWRCKKYTVLPMGWVRTAWAAPGSDTFYGGTDYSFERMKDRLLRSS